MISTLTVVAEAMAGAVAGGITALSLCDLIIDFTGFRDKVGGYRRPRRRK